MSQDVPTISEVQVNIQTQLEAQLTGVASLLPKAFIRVLAKVLAAVIIILYKYGSFIFLQLFVTSASFKSTEINGVEYTPLIEWGRLIGVGDPGAATYAEDDTSLVVTTGGGTLEVGTQFLSDDNGLVYLSTAAVALSLASSPVTVPLRCVAGGLQGNLNIGKTLNFVTPRSDVESFVTITANTVSGVDAETEGSYRLRVSDRFRKRLQGGAYVDYEYWGELPTDIENVYPYTGPPGRVSVYSESKTTSDGIPTAPQLLEVWESIQANDAGLATRRPANAYVDSYPITRTYFDVTVFGLVVDGEQSDVEDLITKGVLQYLLSRAPFIDGTSVTPRVDRVSHSAIAGIVENAASASNGYFAGVLVQQSGDTISVYSLGEGEKSGLTADTVIFS